MTVIAPTAVSTRQFEFHSNFWLNLHHQLYRLALRRTSGIGCETVSDASLTRWDAWRLAVSFYCERVVSDDVFSCKRFVKISQLLEQCESQNTIEETCRLPASIASILNEAAMVYRDFQWEYQNHRNREWIRAMAEYAATPAGDNVRRKLSNALKSSWPEHQIRVDVSNYATWAGAYTIKSPPQITIAATDPNNSGHAGLEVLYHEGGHLLTDYLEAAIANEMSRHKVHLPDGNLWHAVLFYTVGEIMRTNFENYVPYAEKCGIWSHAWPMYLRPLESIWLSYLRGSFTFEEAVSQLVKQVAHG